jgi:hypothetical protein
MVDQKDSYYIVPEKCKTCEFSFPHYKGDDKVAWCDKYDYLCHKAWRNCAERRKCER